jgi:hypothetical protein
MKKSILVFFAVLCFNSIFAQTEFNRSLFDKKQLETIDSVDFFSYERSGMKMKVGNIKEFQVPNFCPYILTEMRQFDSYSFKQKLELLNHRNPVLNAYGFWLLAEFIDSDSVIFTILSELLDSEIKFLNTSCHDVVTSRTLGEFCVYLVDRKNDNWGQDCKKLKHSDIEVLNRKLTEQRQRLILN